MVNVLKPDAIRYRKAFLNIRDELWGLGAETDENLKTLDELFGKLLPFLPGAVPRRMATEIFTITAGASVHRVVGLKRLSFLLELAPQTILNLFSRNEGFFERSVDGHAVITVRRHYPHIYAEPGDEGDVKTIDELVGRPPNSAPRIRPPPSTVSYREFRRLANRARRARRNHPDLVD